VNIALRIAEAAKKFPDKKSVIHGQSFYTFAQFESRSNQMANYFTQIGVQRGMRVLLFVTPRLDFAVMTFALFKVGAIPVLIDPGMGLKNLLHSIKQVRPHVLLSIGKVHWLRRLLRDSFQSISINISLDKVGGRTFYLYQNLQSYDSTFTAAEMQGDDPSAILFTSGGTGIPKGVLYTHGIMNAQTDALKKMFHLSEKETDLPGFPLFALFTLAMGMSSVIPDMDPTRPAQCDPRKLVRNILTHQATFLAGSPAIWERVGEYCVHHNIQLPSVKYLVMFGAPVNLRIHRMFKKILPSGETFTPYGATECLPVSLISGREVLSSESETGFGTCVGKAIPGITIKIIHATDIPESKVSELKAHERGEIIVSGKQVTTSYFDMPEETLKAKIIDEDDVLWHRMGDLGYLDEEQNLWFLGRKSHRVMDAGSTWFPLEVEAPFAGHPEVRRVALVKLYSASGIFPGLVIERWDGETKGKENFLRELSRKRLKGHPSADVKRFFLHPGFPVDVRHNIKVDQLKLSTWAMTQKGFHVEEE
jgi:olefin beta-lactone synthetase